jgi:hypothetical protein
VVVEVEGEVEEGLVWSIVELELELGVVPVVPGAVVDPLPVVCAEATPRQSSSAVVNPNVVRIPKFLPQGYLQLTK